MERLRIVAGETYEKVFLNAPSTNLHITQETGSTVRIHLLNLNDADSCNRLTIEQEGEGCLTEIYGLVLTSGDQQVENSIQVHHAACGGTSRQLFKYILDGHSKGFFRGELVIYPDAQQTSAQQTNRNILLSDTARMRTMPQLEIYADDVKASHGATTGQLDESALFYMRQRGISPAIARIMLLQAFIADIVDTIADNALRESVRQQAATRLGGES